MSGPPGILENVRLTAQPETQNVKRNMRWPFICVPASPRQSVVGDEQQVVAGNQTAAANIQQSINMQTYELLGLNEFGQPGVIGGENRSPDLQLPGGLQSCQITATPVLGTKEWHMSVTPDLRNYLVHKMVQAIFPIPESQVMLDNRMQLVAYAKKVERDRYEMANSRSEYYDLIDKQRQYRKICQLKLQAQQQQQQLPPAGTSYPRSRRRVRPYPNVENVIPNPSPSEMRAYENVFEYLGSLSLEESENNLL
ncbi:histone acetyltransferase p300-like isoform X1 [Nylanderia fulva]|uniref:histone acetyltransferase p300-like isoform X1 n=1 Tax=Nylanderia fulva TaxID=613905 RepID=UPI0010FB1996|nr:histone acetyltransferase p300-like isoform X1 [Nylanderia fulva]